MSVENVNENDSQQHKEVDESILKEASGQGWVPKDKFRGNEEEWVDAETFVKRGREIMPILRKNNETLLKELAATKDQLKEFKATAEDFKKFQKEAYERKTKELEYQITQLKTAKAQAIADGDGEKVNAIDDAMDDLKAEKIAAKEESKEKPPVEEPPQIDPSLQAWLGKNEWFGQDKRLTKMANALGEELREEFPNVIGEAFLDKLDEVLKEQFPEKFGKTKKTNPVESGSGRGGRSSTGTKKSYDNLPDDAKAACAKFVKQGLMTKEAYVESYDWD